jgi:hypothetical protein
MKPQQWIASWIIVLSPQAFAQPIWLPSDNVVLRSDNLVIGVNERTGELETVFYKNRPLNEQFRLDGTYSTFLNSSVQASVVLDGDRIRVTWDNGEKLFERDYRILPGTSTLEITTKRPDISNRSFFYDQFGVQFGGRADRLPVHTPSGASFAAMLVYNSSSGDQSQWDTAVVAGSSDANAAIYAGQNLLGFSSSPPYTLLRKFNNDLSSLPAAIELREFDAGGGTGTIGVGGILLPSPTPSTNRMTYTFGDTPRGAFDEYASLYDAELPPLTLTSRLSNQGAFNITGEAPLGAVFVFSPGTPGLNDIVPTPMGRSYGTATWSSDGLDVSPQTLPFSLQELSMKTDLQDQTFRAVWEGKEYAFRLENVELSIQASNVDLFNVSSGNLSAEAITLTDGMISLWENPNGLTIEELTSTTLPVLTRDLSINPLPSSLIPVSPGSTQPMSSLQRRSVDRFYPENLVLSASYFSMFQPFEDKVPFAIVSVAPTLVGVPEASSAVMCGSGLLIAALVTINRLRAKRTN